jgi:hypothetical protein
MAEFEVEVQIAEYLTVSTEGRVSTEFVDSEGIRQASCGVRKTGRPHDVVARICYADGRKCFVKGKTKAGRQLVKRLQAA